jgi:hypothetical protein
MLVPQLPIFRPPVKITFLKDIDKKWRII